MCCWLAPWVVFHAWLSTLSLVSHTAPHIPFLTSEEGHDAGRAAVCGTVTLRLPRPLEILLNDANYTLPQVPTSSSQDIPLLAHAALAPPSRTGRSRDGVSLSCFALQLIAPGLPMWSAREAYEFLRPRLLPYLTEAGPSVKLLVNHLTVWQVRLTPRSDVQQRLRCGCAGRSSRAQLRRQSATWRWWPRPKRIGLLHTHMALYFRELLRRCMTRHGTRTARWTRFSRRWTATMTSLWRPWSRRSRRWRRRRSPRRPARRLRGRRGRRRRHDVVTSCRSCGRAHALVRGVCRPVEEACVAVGAQLSGAARVRR
jgi:hypothetical protein